MLFSQFFVKFDCGFLTKNGSLATNALLLKVLKGLARLWWLKAFRLVYITYVVLNLIFVLAFKTQQLTHIGGEIFSEVTFLRPILVHLSKIKFKLLRVFPKYYPDQTWNINQQFIDQQRDLQIKFANNIRNWWAIVFTLPPLLKLFTSEF